MVAILSSLLSDYDARQRSAGMKFFVIEQLAIPTPDVLQQLCPWLGASMRDWLATRVLELCYTNVELTQFAEELAFAGPPFRWLPQRRVLLQAEIDAAVLHLYRLTRAQAEWLIDSFTVLRKYEEGELGEFRTKRIVLDIYDAMVAAMQTGAAYRTALDPPPGTPVSKRVRAAAN